MADEQNLVQYGERTKRLSTVLAEHGIDPSYVIVGSAMLVGEWSQFNQWLTVKLSMKIDKADFDYIQYGIERAARGRNDE